MTNFFIYNNVKLQTRLLVSLRAVCINGLQYAAISELFFLNIEGFRAIRIASSSC